MSSRQLGKEKEALTTAISKKNTAGINQTLNKMDNIIEGNICQTQEPTAETNNNNSTTQPAEASNNNSTIQPAETSNNSSTTQPAETSNNNSTTQPPKKK